MSTLIRFRPGPVPSVAHRLLGDWATLAVLMCGTFMYVLDFFVVNVALPSIQQGLHAGPAAIEWVVAGYAVTIASGLVLGGRIGDLLGRRQRHRRPGAAPNRGVLAGVPDRVL